ncbi:hypothetical protein [Commensalibacter papalotli (ex Servin-Garciduenas et al. 2014)]|uniref:ATP-dependent RNA helicase HrpA n=1 Tax=Commensalibacter papalotli (ex Servin-Garciduenas et al. 2014) TaxID=1208583 RepID=W7E1F2_9PROT|nr:hypothetical protein [Commensalibacter papalotli (ex Servin-Garciduenas et al. 2014)]EUK18904.1 ATP-dependent RNA helicase HrpA [Commensalibacter papalotli (ex Servin-Garciduenas et al. 2014)]
MSQTNEPCGIIMPISAIDGCHESHWSEVLAILKEVINTAGLKGDVVSYADEVGIIQKRIIDNLYHNPIVICDVSCKNPNVMFELGMRLAFDKPTIIIKDDCTSYSFDTSPIEHLEYPRDLNYIKINAFKEQLAVKIKILLEAVNKDGAYSPFLKNFGEFTVAKLDQKEVSGQEYIVGKLEEISRKISSLESISNIISSREQVEKIASGSIIRKVLPISLSEGEYKKLIMDLNTSYDIDSSGYVISMNDQQILILSSKKRSLSFIDKVVDLELDVIQRNREKAERSE